MKGLLVDYGGVLTTSVSDSFAAFCAAEAIAVEDLQRAFGAASRGPDSPFRHVEVGAITQEQFDAQVASLLSAACARTIEPIGLKQRMFSAIVPDAVMVDALIAARAAGIRTGLVSNSWGGADYPRERFDELFDGVVLSGEVKLRKPDPEIFLLGAERIGVPADQCVFVDDIESNVIGANAVGMTGIFHTNTPETVARLEEIFEVSLRA